jgi:hypothetical protein
MDIRKNIHSQYLASLAMLKTAIQVCPEGLWASSIHKNKFWHVAYHCLFYTHLYLQTTEEDFEAWEKHRDEYQFMGSVPWPPYDAPKIGKPYYKAEVLEFLKICQEQVGKIVPEMDLLSEESGFYWLPLNKLELQFYNIRHIQQHTGELCERLGSEANIEVDWVKMVPTQ